MAQRHLLIAQPSPYGKRAFTHIHVCVDDQTPLGPWMTTLVGHLGYPLVDRFGAPFSYRLRSLVTSSVLPTRGRLTSIHVVPGDCFVLEPDHYNREHTQQLHARRATAAPHVSRRFLMRSRILATFIGMPILAIADGAEKWNTALGGSMKAPSVETVPP